MDRTRLGAVLLIASALLFGAQLIVAAAWPQGYSLTGNAISDLGVTRCGEFAEPGQPARDICSPRHGLFNGAMVVSGLLVAVGAILIGRERAGRAWRIGSGFLVVSGLGVVAAGLAPWDRAGDLHDLAALVQAAAQWAAMVAFAVAAGRGPWRWLTLAALAVSVAGFIGFLFALDGVTVPGLGFGGVERLSFDTLSLWVVLLGIQLLRHRAGRASAPGEQPPLS